MILVEFWNNVKRCRVYKLATTTIWRMKFNWNDVLSKGSHVLTHNSYFWANQNASSSPYFVDGFPEALHHHNRCHSQELHGWIYNFHCYLSYTISVMIGNNYSRKQNGGHQALDDLFWTVRCVLKSRWPRTLSTLKMNHTGKVSQCVLDEEL